MKWPGTSDSSAGWRVLVHRHASSRRPGPYVALPSQRSGYGSGLQLTEAEAAPTYDAEDRTNCDLQAVVPSVVTSPPPPWFSTSFMERLPQQGQGSGFILDKAGHVLTNFHVVEGAIAASR